MLVSLTLENWKSFRDPVRFAMTASRERKHGHRVPQVRKYAVRILPCAAMYGANASGKSNFFLALHCARNLVVDGTRCDESIPDLEPFLLDDERAAQPSKFTFEILCAEGLYEFHFAATQEAIWKERLTEYRGARKQVLYDRRAGEPHFHESLPQQSCLDCVFQSTRRNQLFLTQSIRSHVGHFHLVFNWFRNLVVMAPNAGWAFPEFFADAGNSDFQAMNDVLPGLDTGILRLENRQAPVKQMMPELDAQAMTGVERQIRERGSARLRDGIVITRENDQLMANRPVFVHKKADGAEVSFTRRQEADGAQRIVHLLPALLLLAAPGSQRVVIIDEFGRNLHTLLTRKLLQMHLEACSPESRSQLLLTTHDVQLMNRRLFRLDELWIAERDGEGVSRLYSVSEYRDAHDDPDIRNSYLHGHMHGIPKILLTV